jgi:uncharacterized protein YebE (UPF0316 family)
MDLSLILASDVFKWIILPLLIFFARILDVTIGTIRIIFVSKGIRHISMLLGFFETLIWLLAITQIMQNLSNIATYIAYAGGFAAGNYVGIWVEEQLAVGLQVIQIITKKGGRGIIKQLKAGGYGITSMSAIGDEGRMRIIYTVVKRSNVDEVVEIIKKIDPKAFYSIEDVRAVKEARLPVREPRYKNLLRKPLAGFRNKR